MLNLAVHIVTTGLYRVNTICNVIFEDTVLSRTDDRCGVVNAWPFSRLTGHKAFLLRICPAGTPAILSNKILFMKMFYLTADCHRIHHILFRVHYQEFSKKKIKLVT